MTSKAASCGRGPLPTSGTYILLRIDDRKAGRELMRRASTFVASAAHPESPVSNTWVSVCVSFQGLKALGVPQDSLDSFPMEFQAGDGREGEGARRHRREQPRTLGEATRYARCACRDRCRLARRSASRPRSRARPPGLQGATRHLRHLASGCSCDAWGDESRSGSTMASVIPPSKAAASPERTRTSSPSRRATSSSAIPTRWGRRRPRCDPRSWAAMAATSSSASCISGSRRFAATSSPTPPAPTIEELVAAKMMGRWRSGAPLALCPVHDDPELGADRRRNNAFLYKEDDPIGYKTPPGSHIRRMNPRDADVDGVRQDPSHDPARHRLWSAAARRGPGRRRQVDRGLMFAFVGAHLGRQFEFVQQQWIKDGEFFRGGDGEGSDLGCERRGRHIRLPAAAVAAPAAGPAAVRRHPRRRVLLHARPASPALARRVSTPDRHVRRQRDRRPRDRRRTGRCVRRAAVPRTWARRRRSSPATSSAAWRPMTDRCRCGRWPTPPGCSEKRASSVDTASP